MKMKTHKMSKTSKGASRLWIEGKVLLDSGFTSGDRFNVEYDNNTLIIKYAVDGKKTISGNPSRPIVDITGKTVDKGFTNTPEQYQVMAEYHQLVITPFNEV